MGKERNKYNLIIGKKIYFKCIKCFIIYCYLKKNNEFKFGKVWWLVVLFFI